MPMCRESTTKIRIELDKDIRQMLEGLKGNELQRSMSEYSEADEKESGSYKFAKKHAEQILDEIIENVLTLEEMRQINSI